MNHQQSQNKTHFVPRGKDSVGWLPGWKPWRFPQWFPVGVELRGRGSLQQRFSMGWFWWRKFPHGKFLWGFSTWTKWFSVLGFPLCSWNDFERGFLILAEWHPTEKNLLRQIKAKECRSPVLCTEKSCSLFTTCQQLLNMKTLLPNQKLVSLTSRKLSQNPWKEN